MDKAKHHVNAEVCVLVHLLIAKNGLFCNLYFMNAVWMKPHEIKREKGILLLLYIQPGASKSEVKGVHGDRLKISVKAPPAEGAANEAVIEFLGKALKIPKSRIHLISGETSRQKNFWITGGEESLCLALLK